MFEKFAATDTAKFKNFYIRNAYLVFSDWLFETKNWIIEGVRFKFLVYDLILWSIEAIRANQSNQFGKITV